MPEAFSFLLGAITVSMVIQVVTLWKVERAIIELRAAIERLIVVDTAKKL